MLYSSKTRNMRHICADVHMHTSTHTLSRQLFLDKTYNTLGSVILPIWGAPEI